MGLLDLYNSIGRGVGKIGDSLSNIFSDEITYQAPTEKKVSSQSQDDMYKRASQNTMRKYGVNVPPYFLKAIQQQESSGIVDPDDLNLSMGFTDIAAEDLGEDYLQPTSLDNVVQNAANYLASRSRGTLNTGERYDLTAPEDFGKWYVQKYVGVYPGEYREIDGQKVSYERLIKLINRQLNKYRE